MLREFLCAFVIYLFYSLSGFLYREKSTRSDFIDGRVRRLLYPFLAWHLLFGILQLIINPSFSTIEKIVMYRGAMTANHPIWYLWVLFLTEVVYSLLTRNSITKKVVVCILSLLLTGLLAGINGTLRLTCIPIALFFYALGNILKNQVKQLLSLNFIATSIIAMVCGTLCWALVTQQNESYILMYNKIGNVFITIPAALLGIISILSLSRLLENVGFFKWVAKYSMVFMCIQYPVFFVFNSLSKKMFGFTIRRSPTYLIAVIASIATIITMLILCKVVRVIANKSPQLKKIAELFTFPV